MKQINRPLPVKESRKPTVDIPLSYKNVSFLYPMSADGKIMSLRERQIYQAGVIDGSRLNGLG